MVDWVLGIGWKCLALLPRLSVHYVSPTMRTMIIFFFSCPFLRKSVGLLKINSMCLGLMFLWILWLIILHNMWKVRNLVLSFLDCLSPALCMYCIWLERNNRISTRDKIPEEVVLNKIVNMIRIRVMSITSLKKHASQWCLVLVHLEASLSSTKRDTC